MYRSCITFFATMGFAFSCVASDAIADKKVHAEREQERLESLLVEDSFRGKMLDYYLDRRRLTFSDPASFSISNTKEMSNLFTDKEAAANPWAALIVAQECIIWAAIHYAKPGSSEKLARGEKIIKESLMPLVTQLATYSPYLLPYQLKLMSAICALAAWSDLVCFPSRDRSCQCLFRDVEHQDKFAMSCFMSVMYAHLSLIVPWCGRLHTTCAFISPWCDTSVMRGLLFSIGITDDTAKRKFVSLIETTWRNKYRTLFPELFSDVADLLETEALAEQELAEACLREEEAAVKEHRLARRTLAQRMLTRN